MCGWWASVRESCGVMWERGAVVCVGFSEGKLCV